MPAKIDLYVSYQAVSSQYIIQPSECGRASICSEAVAEEELLVAALSALTLEELVECPAPTKSTRMSLEAATRAALSAHGIIWIVAIVVSCPQFCTQESQTEIAC